MTPAFHYKNGRLYCEALDLHAFSREVETPFYIFSKSELENNCRQINEMGKGLSFLPCYAMKANYNPTLLTIIRDMGLGADVVSGGELQFALKVGFDPQKIVFAGVGKTKEEIELAMKTGIHSLNIESAQEFELVADLAGTHRQKVRIALRVNPDIEAHTHAYISTGKHINKFGIPEREAEKLYLKAAENPWLEVAGIHIHIGSQITTSGPFEDASKFMREFAERLKKQGVPITFLDLGGGIGINYHNNFKKDEPTTYIKDILPVYLEGLKSPGMELVLELGRAVVGSAGILVSKVLYQKETPQKKFLIVDGAMNNLIRPSLYQAYHEIVPLMDRYKSSQVYDVVGPVCETGDFLARERSLPPIPAGEYLAVVGAGAYGQALASNYNLRPRIAEYLVDGEEVRTIFKQETIEDIFNRFER